MKDQYDTYIRRVKRAIAIGEYHLYILGMESFREVISEMCTQLELLYFRKDRKW